MVSSEEFFLRLAPIITDKLLIGTDPSHLDAELRQNTWLISASEEERKAISIDDLESFIGSIARNRREQVQQARQSHGMLFYLWFDMQASQLRFSVISDIYDSLPFRAKINIVRDPRIIIEKFLSAKPDISWDELEVKDDVRQDLIDEVPEYLLEVYVVTLTK